MELDKVMIRFQGNLACLSTACAHVHRGVRTIGTVLIVGSIQEEQERVIIFR